VWVDKKMQKTLQAFGFSPLDFKEDDFLTQGYVVQLGRFN